ncbi:ABC transporter ATP-binding protein [Deferrisoma camini]|uniref:ABC transporter ATP-binding protein n=1 Tax=Deferrisoma camini TaxID=1035120 RepID=UPI00046CAB7F|nr:ABC transporter ATP-binding protein [Deferrisoma camini]
MLSLREVTVGYGKTPVLREVSLEVPRGEVVALLGANGAGKTTIMRTVMGFLKPWNGSVVFDGQELDGQRPARIVRRGVGLVPEGRQIFGHLTVDENLVMGAYARRDPAGVRSDREWVLSLFPVLAERLRQRAGTLSGGEQQMLAIGRALMARPRLLLLDEPSLGLAPLLVREIFEVIGKIHQEGTTVLLVEQNARMALSVAARAYVLETGRVVREGAARELMEDPSVRAAYLGG